MNKIFGLSVFGLVTLLGAFLIFSFVDLSRLPSPTNIVDSKISGTIPVYTFRVVNTYPHDRNAFTQGLVLDNNVLYEGTGLYGHSTLRRVRLETGDILHIYALPA